MKNRFFLMLLSILLSLVFAITFSHSQFRFKNKTFYDMSASSLRLEVSHGFDVEKVRNALKILLADEPIVIVANINEYANLGLLDSIGKYASFPLTRGVYSDISQDADFPSVLVEKDSYADRVSLENGGWCTLETEKVFVTGVYDETHPLYTDSTQFVKSFFALKEWDGIYYIDAPNRELVNQIVSIYESNGYNVLLAPAYQSLWQRVLDAMTYKLYVNGIQGFMLCIICYVVLFFYFLVTNQRFLKIHLLYGAKKTSLFSFVLTKCLLYIVVGCILGNTLFLAISTNTSMAFLWEMSFVISSLLSFLLCIISIVLAYLLFYPKVQLMKGVKA